MLPQVFSLQGVVPGSREEAIEQINGTLTQSGWVLESKDLSADAAMIAFEMPAGNLQWLASALEDSGLKLDDESRRMLEEGANEFEQLEEEQQNRNVRGTLEMTYLQPPKPPEAEEEETFPEAQEAEAGESAELATEEAPTETEEESEEAPATYEEGEGEEESANE